MNILIKRLNFTAVKPILLKEIILHEVIMAQLLFSKNLLKLFMGSLILLLFSACTNHLSVHENKIYEVVESIEVRHDNLTEDVIFEKVEEIINIDNSTIVYEEEEEENKVPSRVEVEYLADGGLAITLLDIDGNRIETSTYSTDNFKINFTTYKNNRKDKTEHFNELSQTIKVEEYNTDIEEDNKLKRTINYEYNKEGIYSDMGMEIPVFHTKIAIFQEAGKGCEGKKVVDYYKTNWTESTNNIDFDVNYKTISLFTEGEDGNCKELCRDLYTQNVLSSYFPGLSEVPFCDELGIKVSEE